MTRYILIDRHSGYIFTDTATLAGFDHVNGTPTDAAIALDDELRNNRFDYAETNRRDDRATYDVYIAAADFPVVQDGQSSDAIESVERECRYVTALARGWCAQ